MSRHKLLLFLLAACLAGGVQAKSHKHAKTSKSAKTAKAAKPVRSPSPSAAPASAARTALPAAAALVAPPLLTSGPTTTPAAAPGPVPVAPARSPVTISDSGPEPQLARIFKEIERNQLDNAYQLTETLLRQYPNFRLGHLIKGDLLLARAHPIGAFGAAYGAPQDRVADLRSEAIARLRGYREKPPANAIPRYLLQMQQDQRYAVVVDAQRSRLYLYENDLQNGGRPRFVSDYYISQGKLGADKVSEGDKKTPVGVYHVTASLPREKLADLYGNGAYPLSYPNEWDKRQGRNGSGIWLHGTPSDTFSRPPKASDGCVVLANPDLDAVARNLQIGLTPVVITNNMEWISPEDWNRERSDVARTIESWRADWESRNTDRYLSYYSKRFSANGQNFEQFAAQKKQVNAGKEWIQLKLGNVSFFRNPGREEVMVVTFDQDYKSNNLSNVMKKRQYWVKEDGKWKIIYEGAA